MKKVVGLLLTAMAMLATSCGSAEEVIKINGDLEETIEVHSEYLDKGVTFPNDKYNLIIDGKVVTTKLGRYELKYSVYTKEGELKKELHRFVNVVDTTVPVYEMKSGGEYYVGFTYSASDFFTYSDNYYSIADIDVSPKNVAFTREGEKQISIRLTDKSQNAVDVSFSITPTFDFYKLATHVSKNVSTGNSGMSDYVTIRISNNPGQSETLTYYASGSLHYLQQFPSSLGTYASIQISEEFGKFPNANVSYHVSDSGSYSTGFANIDATKSAASVSSFRSTINNLNLDTDKMLEECNARLSSVLSDFHSYMAEIIHLDIY